MAAIMSYALHNKLQSEANSESNNTYGDGDDYSIELQDMKGRGGSLSYQNVRQESTEISTSRGTARVSTKDVDLDETNKYVDEDDDDGGEEGEEEEDDDTSDEDKQIPTDVRNEID
jgi:TATA-binding protein-associated factor Taf7